MNSSQPDPATSTLNDGSINNYSTDQAMTKLFNENPTTVFQSSTILTDHTHSFSGMYIKKGCVIFPVLRN